MSVGKTAAQVAHASVANLLNDYPGAKDSIAQWREEGMPKIVLGCNSVDELYQLLEKAGRAGIPVALVKDAGKTELSEPTHTCLAIGPDEDRYVDEITGDLPLL